MTLCLIGAGSNLGDSPQRIDSAAASLSRHPRIHNLRSSRYFATRAIGGPPGQPNFVNAAFALETELAPHELLDLLQLLETDQGRTREVHWAARTLDLDLLLFGEAIVNDARLTLPHPRMSFRRFVIDPAVEVAADLLHPTIGWTIRQLHEHLERTFPFIPLTGGRNQQREFLAGELAKKIPSQVISAANLPAPDDIVEFRTAGIELLRAENDLPPKSPWQPNEPIVVSDFWLPELMDATHLPSSDLIPQLRPPKLLVQVGPEASATIRTWHRGPQLDLSTFAPQMQLTQLVAAIEAMQSPPLPL